MKLLPVRKKNRRGIEELHVLCKREQKIPSRNIDTFKRMCNGSDQDPCGGAYKLVTWPKLLHHIHTRSYYSMGYSSLLAVHANKRTIVNTLLPE